METSSGRVLDEACNRYNEVYGDESLYTAWSQVPRVDARLLHVVAAAREEVAGVHNKGFMAHLFVGGK